jgi:hypothetical protein
MPLTTNEGLLYGLDVYMMLLAICVFYLVHPGVMLQKHAVEDLSVKLEEQQDLRIR